jgi:hypothetical protein
MPSEKWPLRIMVYGAGQAINGSSQLDTQIQAQLAGLSQVATNQFVAAVAQLDSSSVPSVRYVLDPAGRQPITQLGNFNAGDPRSLIDFVKWSAGICPAVRSVLMLSGHGTAWQDQLANEVLGTRGITSSPLRLPSNSQGALRHSLNIFGASVSPREATVRALLVDGGDRDYLSNAELGSSFESITAILGNPIDVVVFDACLMSSWEILQEICGSVTTVVSSVDELSASGVAITNPVIIATKAEGKLTAQDFAATITRQFQPKTNFDSCIAFDLSKPQWTTAINSFQSFCNMLLPWIKASNVNAAEVKKALNIASTSVVKFSSGALADLSSLVQSLTALEGLPIECINSLQTSQANIEGCILGKSVGIDYAKALGLSIWSPNTLDNYNTNRPDYIRLRFSTTTGWCDILDVLFKN